MSFRWAALVLVLALVALTPEQAAGQQSRETRGRTAGGSMGSNYPNPFNPETFLKFTVGDESCAETGQVHRVTVRIYNVLAQPVAIPVLYEGATTGAMPSSAGLQPMQDLPLTCGAYVAFWDGRYMNSGREVSSGVYLWELLVDGKRIGVLKMFAAK